MGGRTAATRTTHRGRRRRGARPDVVRTDIQQRPARLRLHLLGAISRSFRLHSERNARRPGILALSLRRDHAGGRTRIRRTATRGDPLGQGEKLPLADPHLPGRQGGLPAAPLHETPRRHPLGRPGFHDDRRKRAERHSLSDSVVRLHPPRQTRHRTGDPLPRRTVLPSRNIQGRPSVLLRRRRDLPRSAARIGTLPHDAGRRQLEPDHRCRTGGKQHEPRHRGQRTGLRALGGRQLRRLPLHQQTRKHEVHSLPEKDSDRGIAAAPRHARQRTHPCAHGLQFARHSLSLGPERPAGPDHRRRSGDVPLPLPGLHTRRSPDLLRPGAGAATQRPALRRLADGAQRRGLGRRRRTGHRGRQFGRTAALFQEPRHEHRTRFRPFGGGLRRRQPDPAAPGVSCRAGSFRGFVGLSLPDGLRLERRRTARCRGLGFAGQIRGDAQPRHPRETRTRRSRGPERGQSRTLRHLARPPGHRPDRRQQPHRHHGQGQRPAHVPPDRRFQRRGHGQTPPDGRFADHRPQQCDGVARTDGPRQTALRGLGRRRKTRPADRFGQTVVVSLARTRTSLQPFQKEGNRFAGNAADQRRDQ